jgi:acetyl esterase
MSIIERLFGSSDKPRDTPARPDHQMQKVLDELASMGGHPTETLSAEEARRQPTPTDAVKSLLRKAGQDPDADLGVKTRDISIPGPAGAIHARIYKPHAHSEDKLHPVVVYFRGGGWVIADLDVYDGGPRGVSKMADVIVVSCDYRMAPEHRFPAAHEDAIAAWKWVIGNAHTFNGDPQKVAVMGESAGGNLALNVAIAARDEGFQEPIHQVLIYPVAGNDMHTESYVENAEAKPLNKAMMKWFVDKVFESEAQTADPRLNLVEADLGGLPGATVICAEIDPLRSEGELLAERLQEAGVDVRHKTFKGSTHEFFGMAMVVPDAAAAQTFAAHELKRAFGTAVLPI